jgi:N,N'-diacetyllegionaminate synthase
MSRTKFIAEIGENHVGKIDIAKDLIEKAAQSGADYVKFQSYKPESLQKDDPEYEWFSKVYLSDEVHYILKIHAERNQVEFLSAPFSLERAKFLCEDLDQNKIKIASGVMMNFEILDYLNSKTIDTIFLSTGMATIAEIAEALKHINNIPNIYILHCVTQYPCKDEDANLKAILTLQKEFNLPVGYSDHTIGIDACVAAAALGASVIEKHFTFDKEYSEGTDHILSATLVEFKEMVDKIGRIEILLGNGIKQPSESEKEIIQFVRTRFQNE